MRKYVFILILCSAYNIFGQASKRFYAIGTADGLSSGSITSVVQDKTGFIWIGTKNGLNRYDGHDFITYNTSNSALSSNDISSLFIDSSQRFWLGTTGGGLYILDNEQINTSGTDFSSIGQIIIQISEPIPGVIMVVSERGLFKISTKNDSSFEFVKVLDKSWFPHYLEYAHHSYWLGSQQGELFQFNESFELLETYSITNDKSIGNIIFDIYSVTQDSILVGTKNDGLLLLDRVQKTFNSAGIEKTIVRDIYLDSDGILWIATDGKGLYSGGLQNGFQRHEHISGSNISIVSNAIYKIFEDNMRNLWLGTAWNGISVIDQKTKEYDFYYSDFLGEEASGVLSIFAKQNRLFFGADGSGLHAYQNKSNLKIPRDSYVQMIKELDDDFYWIGTFNNGLYRVNDNRTYNYQVRSNDHSISYNDVRDVVALGDKKYLVATWGGGLNWFDAEKEIFNTLSNADSLQPDPINVVKLEELGVKIWVSTFGEGLFSFHKLSGELKRALIEPKNIVSLEALESTLYIGTWDKGLFAMDTSTLQVTQVTNAVLSNNETIVSLLNDENGGLWIATKTGIFHKDPSGNIQQIPQLKGEYHINANTRDEEGTFYFGNTAGVVSFQMSILDQQVDTLNIEMLGVSLFNQEIDHTSELWSGEDLLLAHDQNTLTFDYAGLSFPASAAINYELKLTPLHSDWIQMGAQRSVTFANLTDGAYQLEIRSKQKDSEVLVFDFIILKPWWRRGWALLLFITAFSLLLYQFQRYTTTWEKLKGNLRIEKLTREKEVEISRIKQKFFVNISHEIRTPLTLIIGELENLANRTAGDKQVSSALRKVRSNANHMTQLINELLDFRKLDAEGMKLNVAEGNIVKFVKEIYLSFQNKAESLGITFNFDSKSEKVQLWYDRDQSEKVFYNLLSNAFKYTEAGGKISVFVEEDDQYVFIKVLDTGRGISSEQVDYVFDRFYQSDNRHKLEGFGIGLSIVRDVVQLHGGEVGLESVEGKGSTFTVKLLKGHAHFNPAFIMADFVDSETVSYYKTDTAFMEEEIEMPPSDVTLLIVEDNEGIRDFIVEAIGTGYQIMTASNGSEALSMMQQELPDIIITDVMMPVMDGITFLTKVKGDRNTSHIPVIVLTARTGLIYKKEGFDIGADDYITKPFNTLLLKTRLKNLLKNQERLRNRIRNEYLLKPKDLDINSPDEQFLADLSKIVDDHIGDSELSADFIAKKLGMSHSVIYKKLKALTGLKLVEFVRDYRLTRATKLLTEFGFSIADTCYKVGFNDRKYFSQVFKKKYDQTPTDYIKNHSKSS